MATDIARVLANLTGFYDFQGKATVHVGAGGGQFVGYAAQARHVVAVDPDAEAVGRLQMAIGAMGLATRFIVRQQAFEAVADRGDVVLFEFCLHEMADPDALLEHARSLAPETLVIDHAPGSRWAWYTAETEKIERSWAAVERAGIKRQEHHCGQQRFADGEALLQKVQSLGEPAVSRARTIAGRRPIEIEMTYRIALV
jgi:SAM-dependent methyltransferase